MSSKTQMIRWRASDFIRAIESLRTAKRVVLWVRVSARQQKHKRNQIDQCDSVTRAVQAYGVSILDVFTHVGSGKRISDHLLDAIAFAAEHDAALVAESVDRFIRHPKYHSQSCPNAQAGLSELRQLLRAAGDVRLVTVLHPDTPASEVRAFQRRRGQQAKARTGGGDRAKGYRRRHVLRLFASGVKPMQIVSETGYPKTSVCRWLNEAKQKSQFPPR